MKANQIDVVARAMLRYLQQINHSQETRLDCELVSDVLN